MKNYSAYLLSAVLTLVPAFSLADQQTSPSGLEKKVSQPTPLQEDKKVFLETVFDPIKFQLLCYQLDDAGLGRADAEEHIRSWVNDIKGDTKTMEKIIEIYMDGKVLGGYILAITIDAIEGKDSTYFEGLYDRLRALDNPEGFYGGYTPNIAQNLKESQDQRHAEFKMQTLRNWHAKAAAIRRVTNQDYLMKVVDEVPKDCDFSYSSPQAIAVENITDKAYLKKVTKTKSDSYIVEAAKNALTK